jgi:predicted transcriptional regulator of viral defense system
MDIEKRRPRKRKITDYFDSLEQSLFSKRELTRIFTKSKEDWRASSLKIEEFISILKKIKLKEITLTSPNYKKKSFKRYTWADRSSVYKLANSLIKNSFFSHSSAMYLNGLKEDPPTTIYVNHEQSKKPKPKSSLEQERIDTAFKRKPRVSKYIFNYKAFEIFLLNGKNTNRLGVEEKTLPTGEVVFVTNLERTLIDIAVRPIYSGDTREILTAYRKAKNKISIDTLTNMLKEIDYVYPYHQSIGFFLQRAGFEESSLKSFRMNIEYKFHLDYNISQPKFSKEWQIYYPSLLDEK